MKAAGFCLRQTKILTSRQSWVKGLISRRRRSSVNKPLRVTDFAEGCNVLGTAALIWELKFDAKPADMDSQPFQKWEKLQGHGVCTKHQWKIQGVWEWCQELQCVITISVSHTQTHINPHTFDCIPRSGRWQLLHSIINSWASTMHIALC